MELIITWRLGAWQDAKWACAIQENKHTDNLQVPSHTHHNFIHTNSIKMSAQNGSANVQEQVADKGKGKGAAPQDTGMEVDESSSDEDVDETLDEVCNALPHPMQQKLTSCAE